MSHRFEDEASVMRHAIELARRGIGSVEPNPAVGAVIVDDQLNLISGGHHEKFGGPHAEVNAIDSAPSGRVQGAQLFVTLEPCCHHGKTPPCTQAVIDAGIKRVVVGMTDPAPHASGQGLEGLSNAGLQVETGLLEHEVRRLNAPFIKLVTHRRPYVHAKWAMTLDGKIASRTGHSQWISNATSRERVHRLRGRMDAIIVGAATAQIDDPLLTARPPGPRTPTRIVLDSQAELSTGLKLFQSISDAPLLILVADDAQPENINELKAAGAEVLQLAHDTGSHRGIDLAALMEELGRREMTNVLVEGGGRLLGSLFDQQLIDEAHVFVATKLVGGEQATPALAGEGLARIPEISQLDKPEIEILDGDVYIHGPVF